MRHLKSHRKLGMRSDHRDAALRNMASSFLVNEKIQTTLMRAKELRPIVEKLITKGREGTLASRRALEAYLYGDEAAKKVCTELADRFKSRPGGYTRIVKLGMRFGDGAKVCRLELVDGPVSEKTVEAAAPKAKKPKASKE